MEDNHSDIMPEPREHLDFPALLIDQDATLSPVSTAATSPDSLTPATTLCTIACTGHNSESSRDDDGSQEGGEKKNTKCPSRPSRMVTRSQTAATRRYPYSQPVSHLQPDEARHQRNFQEDSEAQSSYCGSLDLSDEDEPIELNDISLGKSSPRNGIDLGSICPRCGAVLITITSRIAHNAAHGQHGAHCLYCQQVFITCHGRNAHQHLHGDSRTVDVDDYCECVLCGGAFISVMNLEFHLLELHVKAALLDPTVFRIGISSGGEGDGGGEGGWALYYCGVCGQKFTYSFNLDCHMVLHARPVYCCTVCDASFSSFDPLMAHVRSHRQPTLFAPVIHVPTSTATSTALHMTSQTLVTPENFTLPASKRKASQPLPSHQSNTWELHKTQVASQVSSCGQPNSSGGGAGVHATQAMLKYLASQPVEKNVLPWTAITPSVPQSQYAVQQCERKRTVTQGKE
ncbi:zinc finger protein 26-like [Scylla paramamosain]|uniref:zinc finger protein 26-like n=1 Tax=Scylla paramamosain TaxID=85552 RepID=UPI003083A0B8